MCSLYESPSILENWYIGREGKILADLWAMFTLEWRMAKGRSLEFWQFECIFLCVLNFLNIFSQNRLVFYSGDYNFYVVRFIHFSLYCFSALCLFKDGSWLSLQLETIPQFFQCYQSFFTFSLLICWELKCY